MKFSTRSHYGLRAMISLARSYDGGSVALSDVARAEGISLGYLEQLAASLRKAGLVSSQRGSHGGYRLVSAPAKVTVGEVLRALEGPLSLVECLSETGRSGSCQHETGCPSRVLWERMRDSLAQVLDSTTLADLCHQPESQAAIAARPGH
ncbi:MAG: Rrf2 family transcriptional regulator [Dehalococcoidia bacterium]|nr:Rrf2 family transcriptional regulator [Dehalococcoidia bacterium]